ncbi:hypothetical protein HMPREF1485_01218 [Propionibacterium sp. HGH0353]|nr:hypothetical protein HMPREF1485_01218 [Propionibacterium sp. HGH0353]
MEAGSGSDRLSERRLTDDGGSRAAQGWPGFSISSCVEARASGPLTSVRGDQRHRALVARASRTAHKADVIVPMMNCSMAALDSSLAS